MTYLNIGQIAMVSADLTSIHGIVQRENHTSASLSVITVTPDDFATGYARYTDKEEINVNGRLYDIADKQKDGDNVKLTVSYDEKEEGLIADLKNIFESWFGTQGGDSTKQPLVKQLELFKDFIPTAQLSFNLASKITKHTISTAFVFIESPAIAVLKSPPQLV